MDKPFGVDLPENFGQETAEGTEEKDLAPESGEQEASTKDDSPEATKEDILDLDKLERFRYQGREWTRKELESGVLMRQDYTRKTQELAEARKYSDNFAVDMRTVIANPQLIDQFKKVYPKAYHNVMENILEQVALRNPSQGISQPSTDPVDQKVKSLVEQSLKPVTEKLSAWEEQQRDTEIKAIQSWLDNQYESLGKKYPYANEDAISARAEALSDRGTQITAQVLEKLFKQNHDQIKERMDKMYKEKATKQLEAGKRSRDIGTGGSAPGNAPKDFKNIREATQAALKDFGAA